MLNFRIWDGVPDAGGSNVVFGDTTTNRLTATDFSDIYRISNNSPGTTRPIMFIDALLPTPLTLAAGTYWLDWQLGGTLTSGPFVPPVTLTGQLGKPGANGLQFSPSTSTWAPVADGLSGVAQDFPFQLFSIPEPTSSALALLGLAGLLVSRRWSKRGA